jgi:hypothetical protein
LAPLLKANEDELLADLMPDCILEIVQDEKVAKETIKIMAIKMIIKVK